MALYASDKLNKLATTGATARLRHAFGDRTTIARIS